MKTFLKRLLFLILTIPMVAATGAIIFIEVPLISLYWLFTGKYWCDFVKRHFKNSYYNFLFMIPLETLMKLLD